jgi:hypothetical protein
MNTLSYVSKNINKFRHAPDEAGEYLIEAALDDLTAITKLLQAMREGARNRLVKGKDTADETLVKQLNMILGA